MMDYFMLKCNMCLHDFSEDRLPRNLLCGHSICSVCANQKDHKVCTECYKLHLTRSADDLPVNDALARLIQSGSLKNVDKSDVLLPVFPKDMPSSDTHQAPSVCFGHGNLTSLFCFTCCVWICEDCVVIDHLIPPFGNCRILGAADAMMIIKSEHKNLLDQNLKEIEDMEKRLESQMGLHEFCLKHCVEDKSHGNVISQVESQLKESKEKNNLYTQYVKERMRKSTDEVSTSSSSEVVTMNYNEFLRFQDVLRADMAKEVNKIQPAMRTMLKHLKLDMYELLKGGRTLYAVHEVNEDRKWANISLNDNHLLLHCLTNEEPPNASIKIPFEYVRRLLPEASAKIWFEVGTTEEVIGEVYIRLNGNCFYTQKAVLMNTGEKGFSYKNTSFYEYNEKDKYLLGGDYETNDGMGSCDLGPRDYSVQIRAEKDTKVFAGDIVGDVFVSTKFSIYLGDSTFLESENGIIFGRVIQGLDILKTAAKQEPVTKSVIRDCGVFIPT